MQPSPARSSSALRTSGTPAPRLASARLALPTSQPRPAAAQLWLQSLLAASSYQKQAEAELQATASQTASLREQRDKVGLEMQRLEQRMQHRLESVEAKIDELNASKRQILRQLEEQQQQEGAHPEGEAAEEAAGSCVNPLRKRLAEVEGLAEKLLEACGDSGAWTQLQAHERQLLDKLDALMGQLDRQLAAAGARTEGRLQASREAGETVQQLRQKVPTLGAAELRSALLHLVNVVAGAPGEAGGGGLAKPAEVALLDEDCTSIDQREEAEQASPDARQQARSTLSSARPQGISSATDFAPPRPSPARPPSGGLPQNLTRPPASRHVMSPGRPPVSANRRLLSSAAGQRGSLGPRSATGGYSTAFASILQSRAVLKLQPSPTAAMAVPLVADSPGHLANVEEPPVDRGVLTTLHAAAPAACKGVDDAGVASDGDLVLGPSWARGHMQLGSHCLVSSSFDADGLLRSSVASLAPVAPSPNQRPNGGTQGGGTPVGGAAPVPQCARSQQSEGKPAAGRAPQLHPFWSGLKPEQRSCMPGFKG